LGISPSHRPAIAAKTPRGGTTDENLGFIQSGVARETNGYQLSYVRGPEGIIVGLAEQLS